MDQLTLETEISNKDAAIKDLGKQITDLLKTIEERNVKILREERVNKARTHQIGELRAMNETVHKDLEVHRVIKIQQ